MSDDRRDRSAGPDFEAAPPRPLDGLDRGNARGDDAPRGNARGAAPPQAWEMVGAGRYMPRRTRGSFPGRELG